MDVYCLRPGVAMCCSLSIVASIKDWAMEWKVQKSLKMVNSVLDNPVVSLLAVRTSPRSVYLSVLLDTERLPCVVGKRPSG